MPKYTNHLIHEVSPYLLQHAHNPVDWYPWGKEAFDLARKEDKPIFLSIGYSSCHWCHVMEKESFENEEIASLMNRLFVNIKVDREERPDIDQKYMRFVQMTTGSGGWPLTVFLTPDGEPFYGGTYFPAEDRYGKPGLKKLLPLVADYYHNNRTQLETDLQKIRHLLDDARDEVQGKAIPDFDNWKKAVAQLSHFYDPENGGLGKAPKFPSTAVFDLFLRYWWHTKETQYLTMTKHTLRRMALGGIYDQLGGGFARYSVDAHWLVPHFEKMLYDNAQLSQLYLHTYQASKDPFYLRIARETLDFVVQNLTDSTGGFYSSLDADSEGKEGAFYVWTKDEILGALGKEAGEIFCARFGVTEHGNFEGRNILFVNRSTSELAQQFDKSKQGIEEILSKARRVLLERRNKRVHPSLDYKVLTSWNGLMLSAFATGYQITEEARYARVLEKNIRFMKDHLYRGGSLLHVYSQGQSKIPAFADDYAYYIQGLIDSYEAVFNEDYLHLAVALTKTMNQKFYDSKAGGYYFAAPLKETTFEKPLKSGQDGSLPAVSSVMIMNQLRLFSLTEDEQFLKRAEALLKKYGRQALENPFGYATYLHALDFYLSQPAEIVILRTDDGRFPEMRKMVFADYVPNKVLLVNQAGVDNVEMGKALLRGRKAVDGKTTAYVCVGQSCSLPVVESKKLRELLQKHHVVIQ